MDEQLPSKREPTPEGLIAVWHIPEEYTDFAVQTSLPEYTPDERARIIDLIEAEALKGGDLINAEFAISDYIAHPVNLTNEETGEISPAVRIVFPQPDGKPVAFVSMGVLRSLGRLAWQQGRQPPFDPPIRVVLKQISARGGRRTFKLIQVKEQ